jgi:hypothetical protein
VEGERNEDEGPLEDADEREGVEELDLEAVGDGAVDGLEVGEDVLDEEGADGDDAGERVGEVGCRGFVDAVPGARWLP